jgi:hypothetical protein
MKITNRNIKPKLKKNGWTKFVFFSDNHGDMQDDDTCNALVKFIKDFNPDIKVHGGDGFDIRSLRKNAIGAEEYNSMDNDILVGLEFIRRTKPDVYLYGNHEHRLFKSIESTGNGIIRDYCKRIVRDIEHELRMNGCKLILPYHAEEGVYEMGPISMCHAYSVNQNSVREHAIHYSPKGGATLIGHLHTIMQANAKRHGGVVGFCGGCLCNKRKMGYATTHLNTSSWGNGWLYGWVKGNNWKVLQAHKVGGKWLAPIDFRLY